MSDTCLHGVIALHARGILAGDAADYQELTFVATDHAFDGPDSIGGGWTRVILDNQGAADHHAILLRLNEGVTPDDFGAAAEFEDFGEILRLAIGVGGPLARPGGSSSVLIDLQAGTHAVVCVIPDEDGIPRIAHGMVSILDVSEGESGDAPEADARIELMEMMFHGLDEMTVEAGPQVWEVITTGDQLHEIVVFQVSPDLTLDEALAIFGPPAEEEEEGDGEGPPFWVVGGVVGLGPGETNYAEFDFEPGDHFAICFFPDPEIGAPHFALGIIHGFVVE